MSKLERWLPFMFRRRDQKDERDGDRDAGRTEQKSTRRDDPASTAMSPWFSPHMHSMARAIFSDPFFSNPVGTDPFARFSEMERWFGDFSPSRYQPSVEVSDEKKDVKVTAELPGMSREDIQLELDDDLLVIRGEKKSESEEDENGVYRTERYYGYVQRAVPLPSDVDREKAAAKFENGVLTVRLPKVKVGEDRSLSIPISG